ncbi:MAG: hypothetical protein K2M91_02425, partial [Lachnospiraceae bacterium]|nr:hypothetical protein [Lachnospiraceae bacterium]
MMQQGVDSRAMFATFITKLPKLLVLTVVGAVLGSGLHLLITLIRIQEICYVSETEYYIEFARDKAKDYYNDFTWNDVLATNSILGRAMELLGDGYERNQVKEMIRADILSDVRYLTITVKGREYAQVEAVKDALGTALEEFGEQKKEFDSIYKIEDLEIVQEKIPYFAWRAAFLGAVIAGGIGVFATAFCFCMGSVFYTKGDIVNRLELPVSGMTFVNKHTITKNSALEQRQLKMLEENLRMLTKEYSKILLIDASEGRDAVAFLKNISDGKIADQSCFQVCGTENVQGAAVMAVIPFGKTCREKITDEIY